MPTVYVPVLKGKEGEFAALEALPPDVRELVLPLIEIPDVPYDYASESYSKTLDEHISGIPERLLKCSGSGPLFLHLSSFGENENIADGRTALEAILEGCIANETRIIPVVGRSSSDAYLAAALTHSEETDMGLAVRVCVEDFEEEVDLEKELSRIFPAGELGATKADLIVDLANIGADMSRALLVARYILQQLPWPQRWRRVILAAASFPEDLSEVSAATTVTLPRQEWSLWKAIQRKPGNLPRKDLIFGDYAISSPVFKALDPRVMRMSANIRYTTEDEWLIIKGRNVRQYGFSQYFELCQALVERPEFSGAPFSWGDEYILGCAERRVGPGNATTWRKVGVNHHIALVARALASSSL